MMKKINTNYMWPLLFLYIDLVLFYITVLVCKAVQFIYVISEKCHSSYIIENVSFVLFTHRATENENLPEHFVNFLEIYFIQDSVFSIPYYSSFWHPSPVFVPVSVRSPVFLFLFLFFSFYLCSPNPFLLSHTSLSVCEYLLYVLNYIPDIS